MESSILKPGTKIKPDLNDDEAKDILLRFYGITTRSITELNSYDDRNFLIFADKNIKNTHIKNFCADGYVLKILNSFDSKKTAFIEGQTALSHYLNNQKVNCPRQLANVDGEFYSKLNDVVIRLYEFIPGKIFCDVFPSPNLFYNAGVYLGKLDQTLKNFNHDGYKNHKTLWMLTEIPQLQNFVYVVVDEAQRGMVEDIITQFQQRVLDHYDDFPKQIIHGDFNEQNILVGKTGNSDYKVIGFLDFGDTQLSCLLFELAVCLTYMMLQTGQIETGGFFLAGYNQIRLIPQSELRVLKLCVCARLSQSLVMGLYSHQFDKGNEYLLTTQKAGWKLLEELVSKGDDEVIELWKIVADQYSSQSNK